MRTSLKETLENLVISSIKDFKDKKNSLNPKRIVLYTSYKIKNQILVFNYTENRFLNQQYMIDKKIPIEIIPYYGKRHKEKGDYPIDIGAFLEGKPLKDSAFLDF